MVGMKPTNKAYLAVTVGAVLHLQLHQSAPKSQYPTALKRNLAAVAGSSTTTTTTTTTTTAQVRIRAGSGTAAGDAGSTSLRDEKLRAAEESLRTVVFLSCWGPN